MKPNDDVELSDGNKGINQIQSESNHGRYLALSEDSIHNHPLRGDAAVYIETRKMEFGGYNFVSSN
jgi:hypothetical protein